MRRFSEHWIRALFGLIVISAAAFIPASLSNRADALNFADDYPLREDGVTLLGYVFNVDWSNTQKITVVWSLCGEGKYRVVDPTIPPEACIPVVTPMDVYINNLSAPVFSYDPGIIPYVSDGSYNINDDLFSFSVDHPLPYGDPYHAPFDWYYFSAVAFVIDKATNESVPVTYFRAANGVPGDFSISSTGGTSYNTFNYDNGSGTAKIKVQSYTMASSFTHSHTSRALTCSMFAINWILTVCSIFTTSLLFGHGEGLGDGVALLPLTVILTIPVIRGLYVGSPRLGIFLDVVGFFPQMLIVVVCAVVVFSGIVVRNVRKKKLITDVLTTNFPINDGSTDDDHADDCLTRNSPHMDEPAAQEPKAEV